MATIPEEILDEFRARLEKEGKIESEVADRLLKVLRADTKIKAEDLVAVFTTAKDPGVE